MSAGEMLLANDLREQGWNMLHAGWPDWIVWKEDPFTVIFLEHKRRNNALKPEQYTVLRLLERLGLNVRINCGGGLEDSLTVEQYMTGGAAKYFQALSPQLVLNYRHEVRLMMEALNKLPLDDPRRPEIEDRMRRREEMLPPGKKVIAELEGKEQAASAWSAENIAKKAQISAGKAVCVCGVERRLHDLEPPYGSYDSNCPSFRYPMPDQIERTYVLTPDEEIKLAERLKTYDPAKPVGGKE